MSAYANIARAWGAEVRGWDVGETIFTKTLDGVDLDLGGEPRPPDGFEVVVSTAHRERIDGNLARGVPRRARRARDAIVVTGAHGKTTTTAMIALALRELGNDPAWIVGGVVPQLGGNAGGGEGWLVVEGDESDRSVFALRPSVAVVTNVELDHHAAYGSVEELRDALDAWLAAVPETVRGWELAPVRLPARRARRAQPRERCLRARGAPPDRRRARRGPRRARVVHGGRAALRARRRARRRHGDRRLRAQPDRASRGARDGARARPRVASSRCTCPHVVERTRHLHRELGEALGLADVADRDRLRRPAATRRARASRAASCSTRCPTRRGGSGRRRSTTPRGSPPGRPAGRRRRDARRRRAVACRARDRRGPTGVSVVVEEGVELARLTTIGTGGRGARVRARDDARGRSQHALAWAAERELPSRHGRARVERPRRRRRSRCARPAPRRRARDDGGRRRAAARGRGRRERRLPAPGARRRSRRARVRVRDPRDGWRRRADERRRVRLRLGGDPRARARRLGATGAAG